MKKSITIAVGCAIVLAGGIYAVSEKDPRIVPVHPNEVASIEIFNASLTTVPNDSEIQAMVVTESADVAKVIDRLNRIKPSDKAIPLDGDYTLVLHRNDGTELVYVYEKGEMRTSTGFSGQAKSDNVLNRLWASLDYPVRDMKGEGLPAIVNAEREG
ncbi:hypothetical protein H7B90_26945 [Cohnella xylanilytica]|uniref:Uncharacterized protein n=1 Tax=Cohnella xylanilytica TaxID=557555 RepID=A0A841U2S1_9BACL|nr:hypothetical protein [Cohnella xylanilytica]MBB6695037.1 hypothetical protein [Cohnella xylanilytica]